MIFLNILVNYWGFKIIILFNFGVLLKWIKIFWLWKKFNNVWNCLLLIILYMWVVICFVFFSVIYFWFCFLVIFNVFLKFNYLIGMVFFICGSFLVIVSIFFFKCVIFGYLILRFDLVLFIVNMLLKRWVLYGLVCKELKIFWVNVLGILLLWGWLVWVYIKNIGGSFFGNIL